MFIFSEEKRPKLQQERPDLSDSELTRLLARMWNELPDKKKVTCQCVVILYWRGNVGVVEWITGANSCWYVRFSNDHVMQEKYKRLETVLKAESEKKEKGDRSRLPDPPKTAQDIWQQSVIGDYLARFKVWRLPDLKMQTCSPLHHIDWMSDTKMSLNLLPLFVFGQPLTSNHSREHRIKVKK